jgi:hypothetical protein
MAVMIIRSGLRRLDFTRDDHTGAKEARTRVVVEFAQKTRLPSGQSVRVELGTRNGVERVIEGLPTLVERASKTASDEFLYRLEGNVI